MKQQLQTTLKEVFQLESFRDGQQEIIESIMQGNDTLVFMPTGGGKSLTYQFPGYMREGVTLVISPLISLMKDQVDALNKLGIRAELLNSTVDTLDKQIILQEISSPNNAIQYLYIAPERLGARDFLSAIKNTQISLIAIDEAHCISQWGHDFRPSYMKIKGFIENLRSSQKFPVVALTATATKKVRADIIERLGVEKNNMFTTGFDRKNLVLIVREISKKEEKFEKLLEIISKTPGSGIIYCSSRKVTKEVHEFLLTQNISAGIYTGAMNADNREDEQNMFMNDDYKVVVATNAFGMGIDKKDIRFVVHYNLPGSIENYYQEVGRAGRDGKISYGIVLASYGDTKIQEFFIENTYPEKHEILQFYDYLYKPYKLDEGEGTTIAKTYLLMAGESGLQNDIKVGSIIKILEKYGILERGMQNDIDNFRGRGITLIQPKRKHNHILIDWKHQDLLKQESYFKLDKIKKLLFYPSCRKRFILEYFGDQHDLKDLPENCGLCDYCIDKKKFNTGKYDDLVPLSVFEIVLDVVSQFDKKFGAKVMVNFLWGSKEKRILEWGLDKRQDYGVLGEYSSDLIEGLIEALIKEDFLEKTTGQYPLLGITKLGKVALRKEEILKNSQKELQEYLHIRVGKNAFKKKGEIKTKKTSTISTYVQTKKLLEEGKTLDEIVEIREMSLQTIQGHIIHLYETGEMPLSAILKFTSFGILKEVKNIIQESCSGNISPLKPIKEALEESGNKNASYFDIKIAIAMMYKSDL